MHRLKYWHFLRKPSHCPQIKSAPIHRGSQQARTMLMQETKAENGTCGKTMSGSTPGA